MCALYFVLVCIVLVSSVLMCALYLYPRALYKSIVLMSSVLISTLYLYLRALYESPVLVIMALHLEVMCIVLVYLCVLCTYPLGLYMRALYL